LATLVRVGSLTVVELPIFVGKSDPPGAFGERSFSPSCSVELPFISSSYVELRLEQDTQDRDHDPQAPPRYPL
jgi:hypothetical protein